VYAQLIKEQGLTGQEQEEDDESIEEELEEENKDLFDDIDPLQLG
jgi:hypothetical protein